MWTRDTHQARPGRTEEDEEESLFEADAVNEEDLGLETFEFRIPGASHSLMSLKECPKAQSVSCP